MSNVNVLLILSTVQAGLVKPTVTAKSSLVILKSAVLTVEVVVPVKAHSVCVEPVAISSTYTIFVSSPTDLENSTIIILRKDGC